MRLTIADRPWGAVSGPFAAGAAALGLLAAWTLLSAIWSDAPARAMTEYDRALLYPARLPRRGLARGARRTGCAGPYGACARGVRGLPLRDSSHGSPPTSGRSLHALAEDRLSYPVGYWNALGLLAAIGMLLAFGLTSDDREHPIVRVLAAAVLPVLGPTLLLTFSRGAVAAGAAGLLVLLAAGRPRRAALRRARSGARGRRRCASAYGADLLASEHPMTCRRRGAGSRVRPRRGGRARCWPRSCASRAAAARPAHCRAASRPRRCAARPSWPPRRWPWSRGRSPARLRSELPATSWIAQYERFVEGDTIRNEANVRTRSMESRQPWAPPAMAGGTRRVLGRAVHGSGAGTYPLEWDRDARRSTCRGRAFPVHRGPRRAGARRPDARGDGTADRSRGLRGPRPRAAIG